LSKFTPFATLYSDPAYGRAGTLKATTKIESQIILKYMEERKPKGLNRIAKID
jgi:hypothetical protein